MQDLMPRMRAIQDSQLPLAEKNRLMTGLLVASAQEAPKPQNRSVLDDFIAGARRIPDTLANIGTAAADLAQQSPVYRVVRPDIIGKELYQASPVGMSQTGIESLGGAVALPQPTDDEQADEVLSIPGPTPTQQAAATQAQAQAEAEGEQAPTPSAPPPTLALPPGLSGLSLSMPVIPGGVDTSAMAGDQARFRKAAAEQQAELKKAAEIAAQANERLKSLEEQAAGAALEEATVRREYQAQEAATKVQDAEARIAMQEDYQRRLAEKRQFATEYIESANYPGLSLEDFRRYKSIINDPAKDAHSKAYAQQQLTKGEDYDPNSVDFDNPLSIFAAVASAIGMALGAYAQAMGGGPNAAAEIVKAGAQQRAEKMRRQMEGRRQMGARIMGEYDQLYQELGSHKAVQDMITARDLARFENELIQRTATMQDSQAKAKVGAELTKAQQERNQALSSALAGVSQAAKQDAMASFGMSQQRSAIEADAARINVTMRAQSESRRAEEEKEREKLEGIQHVPGMVWDGITVNPAKGFPTMMRESRAEILEADRLAAVIEGDIKKYGTEIWKYSKNAMLALQNLRTLQLRVKEKAGFNLGVLTGPDMDVLQDVTLRDPTGLLTSNNLALIQNFRNNLQRNWYAKAFEHGYRDTTIGIPVEGEGPPQ